jgi:type II secretory pathway component PulF
MPASIFASKSLSLFYRELSTLLGSGMGIVESMEQLVNHLASGALKNAALYIQAELVQGGSFADAMARCPNVFPEWQVGVVRAGEKSGHLAESLAMISGQLEKDYADLLKLLIGLAYPAFVLLVGVGAMPFIRFGQCGTRSCAGGAFTALLVLAAAGAGIYFLPRKQELALSLPVVGRLFRQFAVTRFMRALQSMVSSGVPILTAWKLSADACGNEVIKRGLMSAMGEIEQGGTISAAFRKANIFPDYMVGMIASGEKSGSIGKMLDGAASYCEKENEAAIAVLLRIVPVAVYLLVACFIGMMVVSFYAGYFNQITGMVQ